jgi:hypothetical protein
MTTTHIVHSCYEEWLIQRDIPTRETTPLNLNLRRISWYTLIVSQCGQNVGLQ